MICLCIHYSIWYQLWLDVRVTLLKHNMWDVTFIWWHNQANLIFLDYQPRENLTWIFGSLPWSGLFHRVHLDMPPRHTSRSGDDCSESGKRKGLLSTSKSWISWCGRDSTWKWSNDLQSPNNRLDLKSIPCSCQLDWCKIQSLKQIPFLRSLSPQIQTSITRVFPSLMKFMHLKAWRLPWRGHWAFSFSVSSLGSPNSGMILKKYV